MDSSVHKNNNLTYVLSAIAIGIIIAWLITNNLESFGVKTNISQKGAPQGNALVNPVSGVKTASGTTGSSNAPIPDQSKTSSPRPRHTGKGTEDKQVTKHTLGGPRLELSGTLISKEGNLAIINDKIVGVGDDIKGVKVVEITSNKVVLISGEQKISLKIK